MSDRLVLAVPSKGRLMEQTQEAFAAHGLSLRRVGPDRGYRAEIAELPAIDVVLVSSAEIAGFLGAGKAHLGITGEDLVQERILQWEERVKCLKPFGFGRADVVVAVPRCWLDVSSMADLDEMAPTFRRLHGRPMRVATKYATLTRRHFDTHGIGDYRIVESFGATEGTPASGAADLIVDITSTGGTLRDNGLKQIDDGLILSSQACLFAARQADWQPDHKAARNELMAALEKPAG